MSIEQYYKNIVDKTLANVISETRKFLEKANIEAGHGINHSLAVLHHANLALACTSLKLDQDQILAIKLACVLHDVDDHKFFKNSFGGTPFQNARNMMILGKVDPDLIPPVIAMIRLVSCAINGNQVDPDVKEYMLYPRIADRLEAIGEIGIERALSYGKHVNRPPHDENTEIALTEEDLDKIATPDRFRDYRNGLNHSNTTIGHFYDKILHIGKYENFGITNDYFKEEARKRNAIVRKYIIDYWTAILH